ncbi:hypothetical protein BD408DRAFT_190598 [Parasitella parasitica]|nr:hypothetical protein BD408DRAFT_190598 [Parasitella parasitica]
MDLNGESTKRLSFSSRATKIPQKLAQSTFFSLKPTASTLMSSNSSSSSSSSGSSDRLSTRISHMLFRQRTTSGSFVREETRSSSQSLDYGCNNSIDTGRNYPSRSLDIPAHEVGQIYNRGSPKSNLITTTTAACDNNQTQSSATISPYSISSPDRTDFSYYYSNGNNNTSPDTAKDEINSFSPLSHSNSSVSSFADSVITHHMTPPLSPMLPMIIKYDTSSAPTSAKITTKDFADALIKRCTQLIELLRTVDISNSAATAATAAATTADNKEAALVDEMDLSHVKEMEASLGREKEQLSSQTIILIDACDEALCLQEARQMLENDDNCVSLETMKAFSTIFALHV